VSKVAAEFLGWLLFALADLPAVDDHVVFVGDAIDADRTEGKLLEAHGYLRRYYTFDTLLESHVTLAGVHSNHKGGSTPCVMIADFLANESRT